MRAMAEERVLPPVGGSGIRDSCLEVVVADGGAGLWRPRPPGWLGRLAWRAEVSGWERVGVPASSSHVGTRSGWCCEVEAVLAARPH